jgi:oligopeptidase B
MQAMSNSSQPRPCGRQKAHSFTHHGITVSDDYAWLRDAGYPEVTDEAVLDHLKAENAWFEDRMARTSRIESLFKEMRGRIKEADRSVPQKDGDYLYWIEYQEGAEYKKVAQARGGRRRRADPRRGGSWPRGMSISASARLRFPGRQAAGMERG